MIKSYDRMTTEELVMLLRQQDRIIDSLVREMKRVRSYKCKSTSAARRKAALKRWEGVSPEERHEFGVKGGRAKAARVRAIKESQAVLANGTNHRTEDAG